jgi:hypothetical protein
MWQLCLSPLYNRAEGVQTLAVSVPAEAANAGARLSVALLGEGLALELDAGVGLPVHHGPVLAQRGHPLSQAPAEVLTLKQQIGILSFWRIFGPKPCKGF